MKKTLYFLRQVGFDPIKFIYALKFLPHYVATLFKFLRLNKSPNFKVSPVLQDFRAQAGSADGHYFWQDLICAQWIYAKAPNNHLDVGSRIDGFVAHLLSFMNVTLLDIRPLKVKIPNLTVEIGDAQKPLKEHEGSFKSVSSLHAIEHFGLGRYGDNLDVEGHRKGLVHIAETVAKDGHLYVSFPIGKASVEFNEQRVIDPMFAQNVLTDFTLEEFVLIPWKGSPIFGTLPENVDTRINGQAGLYCFKRF